MTDAPPGGEPQPANETTTVGAYEIITKIGRGAMGTVFRARQTTMDRIVALKILKPSVAQDDAFLTQFLGEVRVAAQLNHPNIVQAYDTGKASGYTYFAMEFVDGHTLQSILDSGGPMPEQKALEVTRDIARALECAHNASVIHRDVKPGNILVSADNTAKLADLGIAHCPGSAEPRTAQAGIALGTPNYISPEQVRGETDIDSRADIYSLGATLYHMLTGAPPYVGGTTAEVMSMHLTKSVPNPRTSNPRISVRTNTLIRKAMAKNRNNRYATAHEFLAEVETLLSDAVAAAAAGPKPAMATPEHMRERRARPSMSGVKIAVFAVILIAFGSLGIWAMMSKPDRDQFVSTDARELDTINKWVDDHPGDYTEALSRYRILLQIARDPRCKQDVTRRIAETMAKQTKAADKEFAKLTAKADKLKQAGNYIQAAKTYNTASPELRAVLRTRTEKAKEAVREEASTKIKLGLVRVREHLAAGDTDAGLKELDKIALIQYRGFVDEQRDLRRKIEQVMSKRVQAARKKVIRALHTIDAPAARGNLVAAARAAEIASQDPDLKYVKASAETLARIGEALLKAATARNRRLTARTPEEHIAVAIIALGAEDPVRMAAALKSAGDHEFSATYAAKLQNLQRRLRQRDANKLRQQHRRLAQFRATVPAALKTHRYDDLLIPLDVIIADPKLSLIKEEAMSDRRMLAKLANVLRRIRSNVRVEAKRKRKTTTRRRGMPATIEAYDSTSDQVTFSTGQPEAISAMRPADLKILLDLSPGPPAEYNEGLALLYLAAGQPLKAEAHAAKADQRDDIGRLTKILRENAAPETGGPE